MLSSLSQGHRVSSLTALAFTGTCGPACLAQDSVWRPTSCQQHTSLLRSFNRWGSGSYAFNPNTHRREGQLNLQCDFQDNQDTQRHTVSNKQNWSSYRDSLQASVDSKTPTFIKLLSQSVQFVMSQFFRHLGTVLGA